MPTTLGASADEKRRGHSTKNGFYGHLTRRNLAALAADRGDHAEVERLWNDVLAECPGDPEALSRPKGLHAATRQVSRLA